MFPWTVWRDVTCTSSCDHAIKIWNFSTSFSFFNLFLSISTGIYINYLCTHTRFMLASCARSKCTSRLLSMATGLTDACCVPAPPASHVEEGKEENIVGLDIYVTGPASATKAVILAPDIFGRHLRVCTSRCNLQHQSYCMIDSKHMYLSLHTQLQLEVHAHGKIQFVAADSPIPCPLQCVRLERPTPTVCLLVASG